MKPYSRRNLLFFLLILSLLCIFIAVCTLTLSWWQFIKSPIVPAHVEINYELKPGFGVKKLAYDLHVKGLLKQPRFLRILAVWHGDERKLQAGEYRFIGPLTAKQILAKLIAGDVIQHSLTLVEGWTFAQILSAINQSSDLKHDLVGLSAQQIMAKLGYPEQQPEGRFFPDTYRFSKGSSDIELLRAAYQAMQTRLNAAWEKRAVGLPYENPYQALTVASLIEKETSLARERPLIAGVIIRRLQKNMRLQIDASVVYGLGANYQGRLSSRNLKTDTPYNLYKHRGLPPTPIAMPGKASLQAAMQPSYAPYLYFVAKGDGSHQFSVTLVQHNKAVKRYQLGIYDESKIFPQCYRYFWRNMAKLDLLPAFSHSAIFAVV